MHRRCLVSLSRGGADAHVVREFDTVDKRFVDGGFVLPEAKSELDWMDSDHVYVGSDFGPGSLTDSGYPRVIKRWTRGQPLSAAVTVFEGQKQDVAVSAGVDLTPGHERTVFSRALDFYNTQSFLLQGDQLVPLDKPQDAQVAFHGARLFVELRSDWKIGRKTWPRGSLLVADAAAYLQGDRKFTALFTPTATRSLAGYAVTRSTVIVNVLDKVASRLQEWRAVDSAGAPSWTQREMQAPYPGQLAVTALFDSTLKDDPLAEHYLLNAADFLNPDTLQLGRTGDDTRQRLKSRPTFFDANGMRVEQRFTPSKDGTRIPYFVIWPKGAKPDAENPTLLYGYGGFEVSLTPEYSRAIGRCGLDRPKGGVYVLANIRGGGEFGPGNGTRTALKEHKQPPRLRGLRRCRARI